jgi:DNA-binding transcriptional ArsR family regulator
MRWTRRRPESRSFADRVGLPHQNTSHHLSLLWRAGILRRRRLGNLNLYAIEDWTAWWAVQQIARELRSGTEGQDVGLEDSGSG